MASFLLAALSGCVATTPVNHSFPITVEQSHEVLTTAASHPKPLDRPLVIVGGFFDPGWAAGTLAGDIRAGTHDDRILAVPLGFDTDYNDFRRRILTAVDKAFPSNDPHLTTDVDVIGVSMGGVAARYAALNPLPGRRLQIHRLFTISSPHQGLVIMQGVPIHLLAALEQLRPGSDFLNAINNTSDPVALYPIYSYACVGDWVVGESFAAPPGQRVWWLSGNTIFDSHNWAWHDSRIVADILRRLRDETPLTTDPPAPLPK